MNKIAFLITYILLITGSLYAQQSSYSTFYYQRASIFEKLSIDSTDIVFLGNSITNFGEWGEFFKDYHVKNRGISGDRTEGVLARLNTILPGKPKKIFLMIGVNDLEHGSIPDSVVAGITRIVTKITVESPKTILYVQSILPVNDQFGKFPKHTDKGAFIIEINSKLKLLCKSKNLTFIDLYTSFKNKNDEKLNPDYTNDGLHLMGEGYLLWTKLISKYVLGTDDQKQPGNSEFLKARFIVKPELFISHTATRSFIGPGTIQLKNGDIIMSAPWGRPPTNFEQLAASNPVPMLYRSKDGGRTWNEEKKLGISWNLPGMISDGGISFLRLKDGRLAFLAHRHVQGLHGGGLPVISFSADEAQTWTPAQLVGNPEGVWYVMNDRLIQMNNGRIVVPVSHMPEGQGLYEGDSNLGLCFYSDDGAKTWQRSKIAAKLDDGRGMAEPCVVQTGENKLLMLARTGSGFIYCSKSNDGGISWSTPEPTTLMAACSPLTLKSLPDGRLIVFFDYAQPNKKGAFFPRTPLVYSVSEDNGETWSKPVIIDDEGMENNDRQNIYPSVCFTKEGILILWSTHAADPAGSFANGGKEGWKIGGGKRAIIAYPEK